MVAASATLIAFLLLTFLPGALHPGRRDGRRLASIAFLISLGVRLFTDGITPTLPVVWTLERLLRGEGRENDLRPWDAMLAGSFSILMLFLVLGYGAVFPFRLFSFFLAGLLGVFPLRKLLLRMLRTRKADDAVTAAAALLWPALGVIHWATGADFMPIAVLAASCAAGLESWRIGRDSNEGDSLLVSLHARFLGVERTMERQDRLIAAGVVAAGTAHEFKNVLSLLRVTAEHALGTADAAAKDRDLALILEQAKAVGTAVTGHLERISREGREPEKREDLGEALQAVLALLRAAFRADGIQIRTEIPNGIRVRCRIGELEQILLDLVRNAVDAYRTLPEASGSRIVVIAARSGTDGGLDAPAVLEVRDKAGGVPEGLAPYLFQFPVSAKGSTGVGLYLARELAVRNGGRLDHVRIHGGSCFRLTLPAAGTEPP